MNIVNTSDDDLGPTTAFIVSEIKRRGIPFRRFGNSSLLILGYGSRQRKIRTAVTELTSGLGMEIASDKEETKQLLMHFGLPVPRGFLLRTEADLLDALKQMRYPLVIKPLSGNHGRGVTTHIDTEEKAAFAFELAKRISSTVIVEEFIRGDDYRFLVIDYKLSAVAKRTPAHVIGDGVSTVSQLIDKENENPQRGDTDEHVLAPIRVDAATREILFEKKLSLDSVLPEGEVLYLKTAANISAGGTSSDVTDIVHPENMFLVQRVAEIFNLDICGVDIIATRIDMPIMRETGAIIEVNAGPGLRMHSDPTFGKRRNVARPIIDMLFPKGIYRIPVVGVVAPSAEPVVRMIAHMAKQTGYYPGCSTGSSVLIHDHLVTTSDDPKQGLEHAGIVLFDPTVEFAVITCLPEMTDTGFDRCDVAVLMEIPRSEDWQRIAQKVVRSVNPDGHVIVDADNDAAFALSRSVNATVALFSMDPENERIREHRENGGLAAILENCFLSVCSGRSHVRMEELGKIPFCRDDEQRAKCVLAALLAGYVRRFHAEDIRRAIRTYM